MFYPKYLFSLTSLKKVCVRRWVRTICVVKKGVRSQVSALNLLTEDDGFVWKGHECLAVNGGDILFPAGFQPRTVVQVNPPALCTVLAVHPTWRL